MTFRLSSALVAACLLCTTGVMLAGPALALPKAKTLRAPVFEEDKALASAIAGPWRPVSDTVRDKYRHPSESLTFWGLQPGMTVVDLQPGGGYWTQILAPYAKATGGRYLAGVADLANPALSDGAKKGREAYAARFADEKIYGKVELVNFGPQSAPLAPAGTVDFILTSRELHNWVVGGKLDKIMGDAFAALKPGGVFAVEDHRVDTRPEAAGWKDGYISTATVLTAAKKAGFVLEAASNINANPKDTKDYPFGVWTLPPARQSTANGKTNDAAFDHTKYDAIGESDRMTLRFRKPVG